MNMISLLGNLRGTLAERLSQLRQQRKWTQHDLAAAAGMTAAGVRGYEQRRRWPSPEDLEALAKALGVEVLDLLTDPKAGRVPTPNEILDALSRLLGTPARRELLERLASMTDGQVHVLLLAVRSQMGELIIQPAPPAGPSQKNRKP